MVKCEKKRKGRYKMAIIEVKNLVKTYKIIQKEDGLLGYFKNLIKPRYKEFIAVNNINFEIEEGELVGYIGENGARKINYYKNVNRSFDTYFWKSYSKWNSTK